MRRYPRKFEKIQGIQKKFNKLFNEKSKIHQTKFEKLPDHSDPIKADQNLFTGKIYKIREITCHEIFFSIFYSKKCM